jgi:hypothetical protein
MRHHGLWQLLLQTVDMKFDCSFVCKLGRIQIEPGQRQLNIPKTESTSKHLPCNCQLKVKVKFALSTPWRYIGRGGIAPVIHDLGTKWRWVVGVKSRPPYPCTPVPIEWRGGGEVTTGVDVLENISCICPDSGLRSSIPCFDHCIYYAKLNEADSLRVRMKDFDLQLCPLWTYCMWFDEVVSHFWELYQFWERTWLFMLSCKAVCHLLRNESGSDFHFSTGSAPGAPVCSTFRSSCWQFAAAC